MKETYYWGKFKMVKGKMIKIWTDSQMTRDEMLEWDDTYRHMHK